jgi:heavy metal translocating P-type ATPase
MEARKQCTHCHQPVINPVYLEKSNQDEVFCCHGCKTVYQILGSKGLQDYYTIRDRAGVDTMAPVTISDQKYTYLDNQEFKEKYCFFDDETQTMKFYIEGVHCIACLWLVEKLPEFMNGVLNSKLDFGKSIATITLEKNASFAIVAKELEMLGYRPHPLKVDESHEAYQNKENRKDLIRIGIAGFSAGNVMIYTFAIYAGAKGENALLFNWWAFAVALPTLLYSAIPFYRSAWSAIKKKSVSIDVPIVIAILFGSITGLYNIIIGKEHIYFDSLVTLIFLLLSARYILKRAQQKGLSSSDLSNFFSDVIARKVIANGNHEEVHTSLLNPGDKLLIKKGEVVPADGKVLSGNGYLNLSILTGESVPNKITNESEVFFGSKYDGEELLIEVTKAGENSRLGELLKRIEDGWNKTTNITRFSDKIAKYLVSIVFLIALVVFSYFTNQGLMEEGFNRLLTLVIITCPCALGLTTPLAFTLTLSKLAKRGIVIKDEAVLERILKVKDVFFDKTGTLTYGQFKVIDTNITKEYASVVHSMESISVHPIAKTITQYLEQNFEINHLQFNDHKEVLGEGIIADEFQLKASPESSEVTKISLFKNEKEICYFEMADTLREDASDIIDSIKNIDVRPYLLTGDKKAIATNIAKQINISNVFSEVSPEQKNQIIQEHPYSMMVGDGVNDALALSNSSVGVAVHSSVDISLRAADIYLSRSSLKNILLLLKASRFTMKLVKVNLIFSVLYNIIGIYLAIIGQITPLLAAILMPLSSLTVLVVTLIGSRKIYRL